MCFGSLFRTLAVNSVSDFRAKIASPVLRMKSAVFLSAAADPHSALVNWAILEDVFWCLAASATRALVGV